MNNDFLLFCFVVVVLDYFARLSEINVQEPPKYEQCYMISFFGFVLYRFATVLVCHLPRH